MHPLREGLERYASLLGPIVFVGVVGLACSAGNEEFQRRATVMLVTMVFVVGLYVFAGNSGIVSFGHVAFMAIGAYTSGLLTSRVGLKTTLLPDLPSWLASASWPSIPAALFSGLVAAVFAALIGMPLMRLAGLAAGIATLAILVIVYVVISQWDALTGGLTALGGIPTDTSLFTALVWALIAICLAFAYQVSRSGMRLKAVREDEIAARGIGIGVYREREISFVLSAFLCGISGALYAHFLGSITPDLFYFKFTFLTIAMLVVGGITTLSGAVVGTVFVAALQEGLRNIEVGPAFIPARPGLTEVGLAVFLLVVLIFRPRGLTNGREFTWPPGQWWNRMTTAAGRALVRAR